MTDIVTYCDVNTCEDCPRYGDDCDGDKRVERTDYISRADAIEMAVDVETPQGTYERAIYVDDLMALPSADAVSREFYEDAVKANIGIVIENRKLKEQIESAEAYKAWTGEEMGKTSDLISRSDAIEAVESVNKHYSNEKLGYVRGLIKNRLMELPSADAEWIPCSERLPKAEDMYQPPEQRYLCQLEAYGERKFCVLSRLKGAISPFWDWYGVAVHDSEVTAWMPLPKPYREEGE